MMTMNHLLTEAVAHRMGWVLIHFVWQGAAVAALLAVLLLILRKRSAGARYAAGCIALVITVLLPVLTFWYVADPSAMIHAGAEPGLPAAMHAPAALPIMTGSAEQMDMSPISWSERVTDQLEHSLPWVVAVWLAGVFALSVRLFVGWAQAQRIRRVRTEPMGAFWQEKLQGLIRRIGVRRKVELVQSALAQVPIVIGHLRPVILIPTSALLGLTVEQLEVIIAHELAHIRRHDYLVNLFQTVAETLLFYHPAVWWISRQIRIERENCCDDLAVGLSGDRLVYAQALVAMEELTQDEGERRLAMAAGGGSLLDRIRRLVGEAQPRGYRLVRSLAGALVLCAFIALLMTLHISCSAAEPEPTTPTQNQTEFMHDINNKVAQVKIAESTRADILKIFGEPLSYRWGDKVLDKDNLPDRAIMIYPGDFHVCIYGGKAYELRFEAPGPYVYRDAIRVGTPLNEVLKVLGPPEKTVDGKVATMKNEYGEENPVFENGVLYKNFQGQKGVSYYGRPDKGIRMFFVDDKVKALYLTRAHVMLNKIDPNFQKELPSKVARLDINKATREDVVKVFGEPTAYLWEMKALDKNNLPPYYVMGYPGFFMVFMGNDHVMELRFERPGPYRFKDALKVGSTLDEAIKVVGPPKETLVGQKNGFVDGTLYKDIEGRKGYDYYARQDQHVRLWFMNDKVLAIYVTSDHYSDGGYRRGRSDREKVQIPLTSKLDERGYIVDKIDYPFVNDPAVIGTWQSVDFVSDIKDFRPDEKNWTGSLYLKKLVFLEGGKTSTPWQTWTEGLVLDSKAKTASRYTIRKIDGTMYMFFEWKSGDYIARHMKPLYYVLKKVGTTSGPAKTRIGTYDSRAVAVAFVGSEPFNKWMADLKAEFNKAKAAGDQKRMKELEAKGADRQKRMHTQGFSTAPVDDILEHIKDQIPGIAKTAGVESIVSKWDKDALAKHNSAELVDVTTAMVDALHPNERQRKSAAEIQKHKPISIEEAENIKD